MTDNSLPGIGISIFIILASFFSAYSGKLTPAGAAWGAVIAVGCYLGAGIAGLCMLGGFFLLATLATRWKRTYKEGLGFAEGDGGKRDAWQVVANGGIAGLAGWLAACFVYPYPVFGLIVAAALSVATADTLSSELGMVYGRTPVNILTWRRDTRGENGVVSLEGLLAGLAGSCLIAGIHAAGNGWSGSFLCIVLAGTLGNLADSVLGATWERKGLIGNNSVNFLVTLLGALVAILFVIL